MISTINQTILTIAGIAPALGLSYISYLAYLDFKAEPTPICQKVQQGQQTEQVVQKNGRKYAVLINAIGSGGISKEDSKIFSDDIRLAYSSLRSLKFQTDDIYVLGKNKIEEPFTRYPSTKGNLERVLSELEKKITSDDTLFFYVTNHGYCIGSKRIFPRLVNGKVIKTRGGESAFNLGDKQITAPEFKRMVRDIHPNYTLMYFSQCYGGGFAKQLGKGNVIAVSNTGESSFAYIGERKYWGFSPLDKSCAFTYNFFTTLSGKDKQGNPVDADSNGDSQTSIEKAFDYAVQKDKFVRPTWNHMFKDTPQLRWQNADPTKFSFNKKTD